MPELVVFQVDEDFHKATVTFIVNKGLVRSLALVPATTALVLIESLLDMV